MTMTDDRTTEPPATAQMTRMEWMEWCGRRDNNLSPERAESDRRLHLLRAKERLRGAIDAVADLQHELRTRKRRMVTSEGLAYEVDSPSFVDMYGRTERDWRDDAVAGQADLDALPAARCDDEWRQRCELRLRVATSWNTAETLAHNAVNLRRAITDYRDQIRQLEAELTAASRVAPIEIPVKK